MAFPTGGLLSVATGALQGEREKEERLRRQTIDDEEIEMERIRQLTQLASTPGVLLGQAGQALGGIPELGEEPETPVGPAAGVGVEGPPGTPQIPGPTGQPLLDIASMTLGGQDIPIQFDPSQTTAARQAREESRREERERLQREEEAAEKEEERAGKEAEAASERSAWERLNTTDPEGYPVYIEGYPYREELADVQEERRRTQRAETEQGFDRKVRSARTRAFGLLQAGSSIDEVVSALEDREDTSGLLTYDEIASIASDVSQIRKPDKQWQERRDTWEKRLGGPQSELEQDILAELADGKEPQTIIDELNQYNADEEILQQAQEYLRGRRGSGGVRTNLPPGEESVSTGRSRRRSR